MASSSSSQLKYQVFLSFRGEDTRLNFTSHLLKALKDTGMNGFFDEEKLEKGEQLAQALSQAIAASNLSIVILSVDYASSKSCLAELSDIIGRKNTQQHTVLPIFYHVDPSHVRNICGSFKASFEEHESNRPLDEAKRWKAAFVEIGKLKGWHIQGGKFDRSETEYIKDVVQYIIKKLNSKSRRVSEELVGIDDQKKTILQLIEQEDSRIIGLWGMGGIGKTTLAETVYNEISPTFQARYFLQDVREKIEKQGKESLRNELLSKLLNSRTCVDTPSIGSTLTQQRLHNIKVIVVLDDVTDSDQIDLMGVKHFGDGSKIIVTSRDRQVLKNGGVDTIHEVKQLNENDSLQLFSTFAFKLLNPAPNFQDLSNEFLEYAQGSPLALKVLGSKLYTKSRKEWESEANKLKEYAQPKISKILMSSFDELDELEKNIFLDIACLFKGDFKEEVEEVLSCLYKGATCGINNLLDKCLLHMDSDGRISMHDMLEEMGKGIVHRESKNPRKCNRLWSLEDMNQVLKYNKVNKSIEGIKLFVYRIEDLLLLCSGFENMHNLRCIILYTCPSFLFQQLAVDKVDSVSFSDELRYLRWEFCPLKSLSSNFNPKNLVVLKLSDSYIEQLWKEDHQDLDNLRSIDLSDCKRLRKIPNLSGAINLQTLCYNGCENLVELSSLNQLTSLQRLDLSHCKSLRKIPNLSGAVNLQSLCCHRCENLIELPCVNQLTSLQSLDLSHCKSLRKIPNLSGVINLQSLCCYRCENLIELPCLNHLVFLESLDLSHCKSLRKISNLSGAINLQSIFFCGCENLVELPCLNHLESLKRLDLSCCNKLRKIPNLSGVINLQSLCFNGCENLVELPCLNHLTSLKELELKGCHNLKKFAELPNNFSELRLRYTEIEEVPDSNRLLIMLRRESRIENVSSSISKLESLRVLDLEGCERLTTLSGLPRYLWCLVANNCTSLEKISFTDYNSNSFHSLHDGDDTPRDEKVSMSFLNCTRLNQDSIKNIGTNAMLQIQSLAQRWARRKGRGSFPNQLLCSFPGNEVSENEFENRSVSSWINLKIAPNGCSRSRFLTFAICFVANLSDTYRNVEFICKYQLTAASGEKFMSECRVSKRWDKIFSYHVFIVFNQDMIIRDNYYEEASFEFYIRNRGREIKVKECGVHVFYVDEESYSISDTSNQNFDSQEETRFSFIGGEDGDRGPKRLKYFHFF